MRHSLIEALDSSGQVAPEAIAALRGAPTLVALCGREGHAGDRAETLIAAAQMALTAEEEGLAALLVVTPNGLPDGRGLPPTEGGRVEAILAIGLSTVQPEGAADPLDAMQGVRPYLAAPPPPAPRTDAGGDRDLLLSLMEIASATARAEDLDSALERIARALGRLFPVDGAALGLIEEGALSVREILRRGEAVQRSPDRLPLDEGHHLGWVIVNRRPLWRNDIGSELRFTESLPAGGMRSDMTIPLATRGRVSGAFRIACRRRHAFDPEDFETLKRCADLTAVAVETQRLLLATKRLSETDGLTGVCNHRHFQFLLEQEVARARRSERPVSLLMIDIDDFKRINDTHGHPVGDEALRHVVQVVSRLLRRSDVVARYGGEEFAAILPEASPESAARLAEVIRAELEKSPLSLSSPDRTLALRVSIGLASCPDDALSAADLVAMADRGLYEAKRTGKNRVCHAPAI